MPNPSFSFGKLSQFATATIHQYQTLIQQSEPGFDWGFDFELPFEHLSVFARHIDTAAPITKLPVFCHAAFAIASKSDQNIPTHVVEKNLIFPKIPLGVIGTDHVGYGSFDLSPLKQVQVLQAIKDTLTQAELIGNGKNRLTITLSELKVFPFKDPAIVFDALKEGDLAPDFICLRMDIDEAMLADRIEWPSMPAMQTPGITDWRLSPGSFSMSGALLVGADGCETLFPSNLATRLIRFKQIVRTPKTILAKSDHVSRENNQYDFLGTIMLGYSIQYNTEWFPLGHSLGQIAYSLPLAPGEKMKIAIVDWSRHDAANRNEHTTEKEDLQHAALRDRTVSEAVSMVVQESQSGSSFMAGGALSAGAGIPIGAVSLGIGAAFGIGGASSDSQGMRSVVGNTTQQISDAFHQATSAQRELNSTVVIQSDQVENAEAKTRTIANYNHSHSLTILYYEVLQHQRLLTRPASIKPVLFLKYNTVNFSYELIERYLSVISTSLLDESLKGCLGVITKRACLQFNFDRKAKKAAEAGNVSDDYQLGSITCRITSGHPGASFNVYVNVISKGSAQQIPCAITDSSLWPQNYQFAVENFQSHRIKENDEFIFEIKPSQLIRWANVQSLEIGQTIAPDNRVEFHNEQPPLPWQISNIKFTTANGSDLWVMFSGDPADIPWNGSVRVDVVPFVQPLKSVDDLLTDDELCCLNKLTNHLNAHSAYYWKMIWLNENSSDRALRLEAWKLGGQHLVDLVDNKLEDFSDGYAVMPLVNGGESVLAKLFEDKSIENVPVFTEYIEQIITVPSRGVFAEAKLGHCNASEIIDPTRFWDWQTSPIPDDTPEIAASSTDSRYQDPTKRLSATPFPQSIVNIVNPQALPDPTGLAAASNVISSLGPFRDMSGMKELGAFMQTLSNNATSLASQGLKNAGTAALLNTIRSASELSPEQRADLIGKLLTGQVDGNSTSSKAKNSSSDLTGDNAQPEQPDQDPPSNTDTPSMPKPSTREPKPVPAPKPQRSPTLSPKTKLLVFTFAFDTNDVMMGKWSIELSSGGTIKTEKRTINTVAGVSGVDIGNQIEMYVEDTFGGDDDVHVHINGTIIGLPQPLKAGTKTYELQTWSEARDFTDDITRANFSKTRTIKVVQSTEAIDFKITRTVTDTKSETKVNGASANAEIGVENDVEIGGQIPEFVAAKDTVKVSAKGSLGVHAEVQNSVQDANGLTEEVAFKGRKVTASAPSIKPLL